MRELEWKDSGVQPWVAGDEAQRRKSMAEYERRQKAQAEQARELEVKRVLDAADQRIAELRRELGEDV